MGVRRLLLFSALAAAPGVALGGSGSASVRRCDTAREYQQGLADYQAAKFASAASHFRNLAEAQPKDANVWFLLGQAYSGEGDLKGAEKALARSVKLDPGPVAAHRDLAVAEEKLNQDLKARAELSGLAARQSACSDSCPEAADLKAAIAAVQQALGVVAPTAGLPLHGDYAFG